MKKVFIYGTLRRGQRLHYFLEDSTFLGDAILYGAKLYDLGGDVPGIHPGNGRVHGELFEVSDELFKTLLILETGYIDTPCTVEMNGEKQEAITFIWPTLERGYGSPRVLGEVESGDWTKDDN